MALDIYVGPLTRLYTGNWSSIIVQFTEGLDPACGFPDGEIERNADMQVNTPEGLKTIEVKSNRKYIQPFNTAGEEIETWRKALNQTLAVHPGRPLDWPESNNGVYFTDKPGWAAYAALQLWAAHEEHPEFEAPVTVLEDIGTDPAFELSSGEHAPTRYPNLLRSDFWLPGEYSFTSNGQAPNGKDVTFGFSAALVKELGELNARTWNADEATVSKWFLQATKKEDAFESCAKFGFAVFHALARKAVEHGLPMALDG